MLLITPISICHFCNEILNQRQSLFGSLGLRRQFLNRAYIIASAVDYVVGKRAVTRFHTSLLQQFKCRAAKHVGVQPCHTSKHHQSRSPPPDYFIGNRRTIECSRVVFQQLKQIDNATPMATHYATAVLFKYNARKSFIV